MKKTITRLTTWQSILPVRFIAIIMALGALTFSSCDDEEKEDDDEDVTPTAAFSHTANQYDVQFSNGSILVETFDWDFGDGIGSSEESSPMYSYQAAGTYTVVLTVTSEDGVEDQMSADVTVIITPSAMFEITDTTFLEVTVDASLSTLVDSYSWDFGDGSDPLTDSLVTYEYAEGGTKTITLTTTSSDDVVDTYELSIDLRAAIPAVSLFELNTDESEFLDVRFVNNSTGGESFAWDFGDNVGVSTDSLPDLYSYAAAGTYTVTLEVTGEDGSTDESTLQVIVEAEPEPSAVADFTFVVNDLEVTFTDASTDANISTYSWDFGDGTGSSTDQNPVYTYPNTGGDFEVTLTLDGNDGVETSVTKTVSIEGNVEPVEEGYLRIYVLNNRTDVEAGQGEEEWLASSRVIAMSDVLLGTGGDFVELDISFNSGTNTEVYLWIQRLVVGAERDAALIDPEDIADTWIDLVTIDGGALIDDSECDSADSWDWSNSVNDLDNLEAAIDALPYILAGGTNKAGSSSTSYSGDKSLKLHQGQRRMFQAISVTASTDYNINLFYNVDVDAP